MDIQLAAHMTGIESAMKIHEYAPIPIIYLTAYSDNRRFKEAKTSMLDGYLAKTHPD